jgi:hypothetical protein
LERIPGDAHTVGRGTVAVHSARARRTHAHAVGVRGSVLPHLSLRKRCDKVAKPAEPSHSVIR